MPEPIIVTISHRLGRDEARRRVDNSLGQIRQQIAPFVSAVDYAWQGDRLNFVVTALRQTITGTIAVLDDAVRVEIGLPLLLRMAANRVIGRVRETGAALLEKPTGE